LWKSPKGAASAPPRNELYCLRQSTNKESEISMMSMSWLLWMAFMFLFLVPSISYVGVTVNGAAIPEYIQRRRGVRAATAGDLAHVQPSGLGWGGDFVGWCFSLDTLGCGDPLVAMRVKRYQSSEVGRTQTKGARTDPVWTTRDSDEPASCLRRAAFDQEVHHTRILFVYWR